MVVAIAFDIEKTGSSIKRHRLVSIGWCAIDSETGEIITKSRVSIKRRNGQTDDENCMKYFWSKHMELLEQFDAEAVEAEEASRIIYETIKMVSNYADSKQTEYVVLSDYKDFDLAEINILLDEFGYTTLRFKPDTSNMVATIDTDSYQLGLHQKKYASWASDNETMKKYSISDITTHNHYPEDDAQHIVELYCAIQNKVCE